MAVVDGPITAGDFTFQFTNNSLASGEGFFSINSNGASDIGAGADTYLIAMGDLSQTDGVMATSNAGAFQLNGLVLAKGVGGLLNVSISGIFNNAVVAFQPLVLVDNAPGLNPGQMVVFAGPEWSHLDSLLIAVMDGSDDFDIELDELQVQAPPLQPPPIEIPSLSSVGLAALFLLLAMLGFAYVLRRRRRDRGI